MVPKGEGVQGGLCKYRGICRFIGKQRRIYREREIEIGRENGEDEGETSGGQESK